MKTLLVIILFAAIGCYATETNGITTKVYEYKDKDGKVVGGYEQFYRGKDMVMMTTSSLKSQGQLVIRSRSYFVHGDMMMTELAVRQDDKLDTTIVYHPGTENMEVYWRRGDESVSPASAELVQAFLLERSLMEKLGAEGFVDSKSEALLETIGHKIVTALNSSDGVK